MAQEAAVGKTVVSSQMIDRVTAKLGRKLYEVPVGFKWFVDGLLDGSLGFGGEESAGASFRPPGRRGLDDGQGWNCPGPAGGGITARMGRDPGEIYQELTREFGEPADERRGAGHAGAKAIARQAFAPAGQNHRTGGRENPAVLTHAPGNGAPSAG